MATDAQIVEERRDMDFLFIKGQVPRLEGSPPTQLEREEAIARRVKHLMEGDKELDGTVIPPLSRKDAEAQARWEWDPKNDENRRLGLL